MLPMLQFIYLFFLGFLLLLPLSRRAQKCTYKPTHKRGFTKRCGGEGGLSGRGGGGAEGRVLGQRVHIVYFTHLLGRGRYCAVFLIPSWLSSSSRLLHFFSSSVSIPSSVQRGSLHCAPSSQLRHWKKNVVNHNIDWIKCENIPHLSYLASMQWDRGILVTYLTSSQ